MIALLSDIHGNLEALQAVLDDARSRGVGSFYCLGDTVGHGPDPRPCVEIVKSFDICLAGSWEHFITGNGETESAETNVSLNFWYDWVRSELSKSLLDFLRTRPSVKQRAGKTYAHGDPIENGYLFPETIYNRQRMREIFDAFDGVFHCGHTHIGGVFTESDFVQSNRLEGRFVPDTKSAILNVGSVGQPRDNDRRACYVISYGNAYEFIRVPYDYETTMRKLDGLDPPGLAR